MIKRQAQTLVGSFLMLGSALAYWGHPYWAVLIALVGIGLLHAGLTDSHFVKKWFGSMPWNRVPLLVGLILAFVLAQDVSAQQGRGQGKGHRGGRNATQPERPSQAGTRSDEQGPDQEAIQFLLANRDKIRREVKNLPNGVETLTESEVPAVAAKIKEHVKRMEQRIQKKQPVRRRDPLFEEIFQHADKISMKIQETNHGLRVLETSNDPYVAKLIQAHASTVSAFIQNGFAEVSKNHALPK